MSDLDRLEYLKTKVASLPENPGVYQYYDREGKIIYIGKAKNLRKRVSSYFLKNHDYGKTKVLVSKITDIAHIVVDSEEDALLLENNLIKKYQPRYNILLKDDKTYPFIVVTNEVFPRVFQTRNVVKDGSLYFGPYTSTGLVRALLDLFRHLFPLRSCKLNLSEEAVLKNKYKVCLEYHLGNCKGPCVGEYDENSYNQHIEDVRNILKGNIGGVIRYLKVRMHDFANELEFEKAEEIKQKILKLEGFQAKSTIVNPSLNNVDVFSFLDSDDRAFVNFIKVISGCVVQSHTMEYKKRLDESPEAILSYAISEVKSRTQILAREIIVPFMPDVNFSLVKFTIPKLGDRKKLLELSERNLKFYTLEQQKQESIRNKVPRDERVLVTLQNDLRLSELPRHIECFDNSNIQGHYPVAACVVFINGKPAKREYRHFNIKTVEGPDDFASMEEIVYRRYKRLKEENLPLPQLIVVDGGKGQLGVAVKVLEELGLFGKIAIIGIAKRLEEIFYPYDSVPLYLDKKSESLKVIQHLRNEAHRFGITFHRNKRSKGFIHSELESIQGIGSKTIEMLLTQFKSVNEVSKQDLESLSQVIGKSKAKIVYEYFHPTLEK
ncbi:MAG: excinuclease ABC subunit UvrC [Chitinophagales bacterium]|nr:excinuclease ABC subunit UvrC [Chitinophagales bacterium]